MTLHDRTPVERSFRWNGGADLKDDEAIQAAMGGRSRIASSLAALAAVSGPSALRRRNCGQPLQGMAPAVCCCVQVDPLSPSPSVFWREAKVDSLPPSPSVFCAPEHATL